MRKCPWPRRPEKMTEDIGNRHAEIRNRAGRVVAVTLRIRQVRTSAGLLDLVVFHDNHESRAHERAVARRERLEGFGQFAGGIASELNNALTPIVLGFDLLRAEARFAERQLIDQMASSAQNAADLAAQLLLFARRAPMVLKPEDMASILLGVGKALARSLPNSVTLSVAPGSGLPLVVCDRDSLIRALLTFALHGRRAVPEGGQLSVWSDSVIRVGDTLQAEAPSPAGRFVRISLSDIVSRSTDEDGGRPLEPYLTTMDGNRSDWFGLSAALGIVECHGGFVHMSSGRGGSGRGFEIYLPADHPSGTSQEAEGERLVGTRGATLGENGRDPVSVSGRAPAAENNSTRQAHLYTNA